MEDKLYTLDELIDDLMHVRNERGRGDDPVYLRGDNDSRATRIVVEDSEGIHSPTQSLIFLLPMARTHSYAFYDSNTNRKLGSLVVAKRIHNMMKEYDQTVSQPTCLGMYMSIVKIGLNSFSPEGDVDLSIADKMLEEAYENERKRSGEDHSFEQEVFRNVVHRTLNGDLMMRFTSSSGQDNDDDATEDGFLDFLKF